MTTQFLCDLSKHLSTASQTLDSFSQADLNRAQLAMNGSVIQAWYGFDIPSLQDIVTRNAELNQFIGFEKYDLNIEEYPQIQMEFLENGILRKTLLALLSDIEKIQGKPESMSLASSKIEQWMNDNIPPIVFFQQYTKPPITSLKWQLRCDQHGDAPEEEQALEALSDVFPIYDFVSNNVDESENRDLFDYKRHFSSDRTHYLSTLQSYEIELQRLPPYTNWQPTQNYIDHIAAACQKLAPETKVDTIEIQFINEFRVPNVFDYFYLFPDLLKPPLAPNLMRQLHSSYELPTKFKTCWHDIAFQFAENDPRTLEVSLIVHDKEDHYWVEMMLEAKWLQTAQWNEIPAISTKLKNSIYVAFHSLLKEKARQMIA